MNNEKSILGANNDDLSEIDYIARLLCAMQAEIVALMRRDRVLESAEAYNRDFITMMEGFEELRGRR